MADVVVIRHPLATSNDCRESEAIVVVVNECVGELSRGESRLRCQSQTRPFTSATSHRAPERHQSHSATQSGIPADAEEKVRSCFCRKY